MSKISDFLAQQASVRTVRNTETVAQFAAKLHKPVGVLLSQLEAAGVVVNGPDSPVTEAGKDALLKHLRQSHQPSGSRRKPVRITSRSEMLRRAVLSNMGGAEREALDQLARAVIWNHSIDPTLQRLVNVIVAKAIVRGTLPPLRRGRPTAEGRRDFGNQLAEEFWAMRDNNVPFKEVMGMLSERHHKEARHLSRIIKEHTGSVGATREERERSRQWWAFLGEQGRSSEASPYLSLAMMLMNPVPCPDLTDQEILEHLDELLAMEPPDGDLMAK